MEFKEKVEKELEWIRPQLQNDGGDIELVSAEGGAVKVRLTGACRGCPMSAMTLQQGVEEVLKEKIPEVKTVEAVD